MTSPDIIRLKNLLERLYVTKRHHENELATVTAEITAINDRIEVLETVEKANLLRNTP